LVAKIKQTKTTKQQQTDKQINKTKGHKQDSQNRLRLLMPVQQLLFTQTKNVTYSDTLQLLK
jgi:hypothetical protein